MGTSLKIAFGCVAAFVVMAGRVSGSCGANCDLTYGSDIKSCHLMYGSDPDDAEDLSECIQTARDDYRSCLDDCANQAD
jgi:hypothetical protein